MFEWQVLDSVSGVGGYSEGSLVLERDSPTYILSDSPILCCIFVSLIYNVEKNRGFMSKRKVRVRFAPSPTGALHIGGVRTALYNYLFAQAHGGTFILRIEDTDSQRFVPGAEAYIIEALEWLGIRFDEGVGYGGDYGPYRQSERRDIYRVYVKQLLDSGKAYIAFDTHEDLERKRSEVINFQYDASTRLSMDNSLSLPAEEVGRRIADGEQYVVRFKVEPNEEVEVDDLIRGKVKFNSSILDDKVLYKSVDDLPTYHLANIVDDHLMEISHVIRGEEWLPSSPLHVLLYRAFGWEETMPRFAHLSLLLKPEGNGKLSKRDGDRLGFPVFPLRFVDPKTGEVSSGYRESGYLPEAVVNFIALLGWNPGSDVSEVMSMQELIKHFDLERCSKAGAKFDYNKGLWFNHHYIQATDNVTLAQYLQPMLREQGITAEIDDVARVIALVKERCQKLPELWEQASYFFVAPETYDEKTVAKRWKPDTAEQLRGLIALLQEQDPALPAETTEQAVKAWIEAKAYNLGAVMNAFRLSVVGASKGPHMFDITALLGREETIARLSRAIECLG